MSDVRLKSVRKRKEVRFTTLGRTKVKIFPKEYNVLRDTFVKRVLSRFLLAHFYSCSKKYVNKEYRQEECSHV